MDATYGADVAAENNTFDINNTNKNANIKPVVSKVRGVYPVPQGKIEAPICFEAKPQNTGKIQVFRIDVTKIQGKIRFFASRSPKP